MKRILMIIIGCLSVYQGVSARSLSTFVAYAKQYLPVLEGTLTQALFNHTPEVTKDHLKKILLGLIEAEQTRIMCMLYRLTDQDIVNALVVAADRGVQVDLIVDAGCIHDVHSKLQSLHQAAHEIYVYGAYRSILHDKTFIFCNNDVVDLSDKKVLWTGSANATIAGMRDNIENVLVINNISIWQQYEAQFEQIKEKSIPLCTYRLLWCNDLEA